MEISVFCVTAPEHQSHCWAALAPEKGGDPRQWGGPALSSSTRRASILTNAIKNRTARE